jgi:DUF1365 family protein
MSKRQSAESKIITWFESAPMASVGIVLGIVKEKVRMRQLADVGVVTVPHKPRAKAKRKTNAAPAGEQVAFPGTSGATA